MRLLQYSANFLTTLILVSVLTFTTAFGVESQDSWARNLYVIAANTEHNQIAQAEGKAKQAQSQIRRTIEEMKESMSLKGKPKAAAKYIEGKGQEVIGNITGNPKAQAEGKVKQIEGKVRYGAEVVKDKVKDVFK
jgi:uncharacterized protein YjbJ (UPF0337 family)